jgi:phosphoribosylformylglycinamidine synthase
VIGRGLVRAAHDGSDGGVLVAAAEMAIASGLGLRLESFDDPEAWFGESNGRYLLETDYGGIDAIRALCERRGLLFRELGRVDALPILQIAHEGPNRSTEFDCHVGVDELSKAWRGALDW